MTLHVTEAQLETIREHGAKSYPYECCGLLLGEPLAEEDKKLTAIWSVKNVWESQEGHQLADGESSKRRYLIPPEEILAGQTYARCQGLEVVGYYHSHPDHPARPSEFDRDYAWPWYSYVIVAVEQGVATEITSWVLDDERQFNAEPWGLT